MPFHEIGGLTTITAATADLAYAGIWNPTGVSRIRVREIGGINTAATGCKVAIKRTTARGTVTSSTAVAQQDPSEVANTATLDWLYSAQPTLTGNYMRRAHIGAAIGASFVWTWWNGPGLVLAAAAGIAFVTPTALAGQALELWIVVED